MGACGSKTKQHARGVALQDKAGGSHPDPSGEVYFVCCGVDYKCDKGSRGIGGGIGDANGSWAGDHPLDTHYAYDMMVALAKQCNAKVLKTVWNAQCTKEGIVAAIEEVGQQVGEDDYFIFYYTGHGDLLAQDDANEDEAMDSCLCTVGPNGAAEPREDVWLRDDDLSDAILDNVDSKALVLCLFDCCHSAGLCDFTPESRWAQEEHRAISISGCKNKETSAGSGLGGMFSRAMSKSMEDLSAEGHSYAVSTIYNKVLLHYQANKGAAKLQHITVNSNAIEPNEFVWPFQPTSYTSPFPKEQ